MADSIGEADSLLQISKDALSERFAVAFDSLDGHVLDLISLLKDEPGFVGAVRIGSEGYLDERVRIVAALPCRSLSRDVVYDAYGLNMDSRIVYTNSKKVFTDSINVVRSRYFAGKEIWESLPKRKHVVCGWGALGDVTKTAALIVSANRRFGLDLAYIVKPNRKHVASMYPGLDVVEMDQDRLKCLRTYLDLSAEIESDRISYWPVLYDDSLLLPGYRLYDSVSDYDMERNISCTPASLEYSHACNEGSDGRYDGTVLLIPDANWAFNGNDGFRKAVKRLLSDLVEKLSESGIRCYVNGKEPLGKAEPLFLSPEEMSVHAKDFRHIVGPITGLVDLLILSECQGASVLYGSHSHYSWYDVRLMASEIQKVFRHDLSSEDYSVVLEEIAGRCL